jgi:hypothetical protein
MKKLISVMIVVIIALALQAHIEHTTKRELQLELSYCQIDKTLLEARMEATEPIKVVSSTKIIKPCTDNTFKSYMDYRMITNTSSEQYKLQQSAYTNEQGLREYKGFILVAVASRYGNVGDILAIDLEADSIYAIIGDIKDKGHNGCSSDRDGSMVEFIVDTQVIDPKIKSSGNFNDVYQGKIERIINYGKHT